MRKETKETLKPECFALGLIKSRQVQSLLPHRLCVLVQHWEVETGGPGVQGHPLLAELKKSAGAT